jgi:hypothetical protein
MNVRRFALPLTLGLMLVLVVGLTAAQELAPQEALGTAFTYQGQLQKDGSPVDAECQVAFRLYDQAVDGAQVGPPLTITVPITEGVFTVGLDFGAGVFDGEARWLSVAVQCPGDVGFTSLPRQALTAAPYALYALAAPGEG